MASKEGHGRSAVAPVLFTSTPKAARAMMSCVKRAVHQKEKAIKAFIFP